MNTSNEQRLSSNDDLFFKDCFTEVDEGKVDAEFNNVSMNCFNSKNNKFSMDSDGNLAVNSITSKESISAGYNIDLIYPIGSIYMSMNSANPSALFGGTWEQIKDRFLLGCGDLYTSGSIGGEANHTLTSNELPNHNHRFNINIQHEDGQELPYAECLTSGLQVGGRRRYVDSTYDNDTPNDSHNNMPPYLAVHIWQRIA